MVLFGNLSAVVKVETRRRRFSADRYPACGRLRQPDHVAPRIGGRARTPDSHWTYPRWASHEGVDNRVCADRCAERPCSLRRRTTFRSSQKRKRSKLRMPQRVKSEIDLSEFSGARSRFRDCPKGSDLVRFLWAHPARSPSRAYVMASHAPRRKKLLASLCVSSGESSTHLSGRHRIPRPYRSPGYPKRQT